jgi:gluconokinase
LETLNTLLLECCRGGNSDVLACSALKAAYRATLTRGLPDGVVRLVRLCGSNALIAGRFARRQNHHMNPKLFDSQLITLEPPVDALQVVNDKPPG